LGGDIFRIEIIRVGVGVGFCCGKGGVIELVGGGNLACLVEEEAILRGLFFGVDSAEEGDTFTSEGVTLGDGVLVEFDDEAIEEGDAAWDSYGVLCENGIFV